MSRKFAYQEELKIMITEVYRNGGDTDKEWTERYEGLKEVLPMELLGNMMESLIGLGHTVSDAARITKQYVSESYENNKNIKLN